MELGGHTFGGGDGAPASLFAVKRHRASIKPCDMPTANTSIRHARMSSVWGETDQQSGLLFTPLLKSLRCPNGHGSRRGPFERQIGVWDGILNWASDDHGAPLLFLCW